TPIDVHDVDGAVREGLSQRGFMAIPYSRDAAEAIRGSTPYLSVLAAIEPDGGHRVRLCWIGLYEREMCNEYSAGGFTRPVGFGSRLALEAREKLEEYRRRLPPEAAFSPEPGGR
ncbi:MAG TPA: hypothetical protein VM778_10525, partial [Gemmatimonadota bacterium]|nr:hypothetical protein [Gemmatimonadota bacterium]